MEVEARQVVVARAVAMVAMVEAAAQAAATVAEEADALTAVPAAVVVPWVAMRVEAAMVMVATVEEGDAEARWAAGSAA